MLKKLSLSFIVICISALSILAQNTAPPTEASTNKVPGLTIPASFSVPYDEGFVTLKAECEGEVEWLVLSTVERIKYKLTPEKKEIDIAIPPKETVISVFCYGSVDGKPTKAARCDITVKGPQGPRPPPTPAPVDVKGFHITIVEDPIRRQPGFTILTEWLKTKAELERLGLKPHLLSIDDPLYKDPASGFAKHAQRLGSIPMVVIQDTAGKLVIPPFKCPATLNELLNILSIKTEPGA